jgi:hypothetical protein
MQTDYESHDWEFEGLVGGLIMLGGTEWLGWAGLASGVYIYPLLT